MFARQLMRAAKATEVAAVLRARAYSPCVAAAEIRATQRLIVADKVVAAQAGAAHYLKFAAAAGLGVAAALAPTATALCSEGAAPPDAAQAPAGAESAPPSSGTAKPGAVVFVLGGPGAGKGTQCTNIVRDFGFEHLSAGDLLRAHMKSGSPDGNMVAEMITQGQIVPSEVTVNLLLAAMAASGKQKFLIDGFPRNTENRDAWEKTAGYDCDFVLFFECPEAVMTKRLLGRNEGRTDDNMETIKKRFHTFVDSSMPVIAHYKAIGKVRAVDSDQAPEEVYKQTKDFFKVFA